MLDERVIVPLYHAMANLQYRHNTTNTAHQSVGKFGISPNKNRCVILKGERSEIAGWTCLLVSVGFIAEITT